MKKLTSLIQSQLKQFAPNAKNIIVKVERDHDAYLSKIHMQLPGLVLHAQKKGESVWEALHLTSEAIRKQLMKFKLKRCGKRKSQVWRWQEPLVPPL